MEDLKMKLAEFWLFIAVAMSANTMLYLLVPGIIDEIRAGEIVGMEAGAGLIFGNGDCVLLDSVGHGCPFFDFDG